MRFWLKVAGILFVVGSLAGAAAYGSWRLAKRRYGPPAALKVRVETVAAGSLAESISATGVVQPRKSVKISAKISARIVALPVEEGDAVTVGHADASPPVPASVLVRLDDRDLLSRLRAAQASRDAMVAQVAVDEASLAGQKADIEAAAIRLEQLGRDVKRKAGLLASHDIAQAAYDESDSGFREETARLEATQHRLAAAEGSLQVLRHRIEAADAEIEQAKEALSYTTIAAPIDGTVISLNAQVGEMVMTGTMNNAGTVIMEVADLASMIVVAEVDEADVGKVAVGQPVVVHVQAYPDVEIAGSVETIALMHRMSSRGTRYFRTEIRIEATPVTLYSGLTANVDIRTKVHEGVLTVPSQAVVGRKVDELPESMRRNNPELDADKTYATVVYRVLAGRSVVTPVRIGAADMSRTVVEAGLSAGAVIVSGPYKVLDTLVHDRELDAQGGDGKDDIDLTDQGRNSRGVGRNGRR